MVDLHQHTTFSDGTDSVKELIKRNKEKGIKIMSITDHDNIESAKEAKKIADDVGINYITGVEFSTDYKGNSIHILCYNFDTKDKVIKDLIEQGIILRHKRVAFRLDTLKSEFGIRLDEKLVEQINSNPNPNKPMIANILKELGYGKNISEIINTYLYHKMPDFKLKTIDVIEKLNQSSGLSVYAHPLGGVGEKRVDKINFEDRLMKFVNLGLKGVECYYSLYSKEEQNYLVGITNRYNLLISGGSDYHGTNKDVQIGELSNYGDFPHIKDLTILNKCNNS
ncbi:MAG: PHP domain-containing protein [Clostridia bacterium]|nr:PHP domain-containing protein [Clostridia bacterium]